MFGYYAPASVIIFSCKTCLNTSFKLHPSEFFQQVFFSCCAWTGEESHRKTGEVQAKFPTVSHLLFFLLLCALQQDSFISKLPLKNQVSTELRYLYWSWLTPHLNSDALNPAFMEVWAHQLTAIKQKGQLQFWGQVGCFPDAMWTLGGLFPLLCPGAVLPGVVSPGRGAVAAGRALAPALGRMRRDLGLCAGWILYWHSRTRYFPSSFLFSLVTGCCEFRLWMPKGTYLWNTKAKTKYIL